MESEFYLQARLEWDERYGDLVLGKRNWQIASGGLMLRSLILALGIVYIGARTKVIPYIVEVDKPNGAGDRGRTGDVQLGNSENSRNDEEPE